MWICALGLLTQFFIMPIAEWCNCHMDANVTLPSLATGELMTLTLSLLGLGGMRILREVKKRSKRKYEKMTDKLCIRCKVALKRMELKDIYQCPICLTVVELKDKEEE